MRHHRHPNSDITLRTSLLIILCESEEIVKLLDQRPIEDESSLDSLLSSWITDGQYEFLTEIDGRLRLSFTTTEVKSYNTDEMPRRSSQKQRITPVYLPKSLPQNLVQHYFGASKLKQFVSELSKQLDQDLTDDPDSILDRRAALWTCGAILSSNIGVNNYGTCLSHVLLRNLKSIILSVRATAFYATNLMARAPYGADLIEMESKMAWKVKKRFIGDGQRRQRNSTTDSWSTFYWASDCSGGKELYIDSSTQSLDTMDDQIFAAKPHPSKEHLVQAIARTCEPDKPLMVSISRQWSAAGLTGGSVRDADRISILPQRLARDQFREHRSQSDTTAMEVASLRQQYNDNTSFGNYRIYSPHNLPRQVRVSSSVSSTNDSLGVHPEHAITPDVGIQLRVPTKNGWNENGMLITQSLNEQQLRPGLARIKSRVEVDQDTLHHTANGNMLKNYARFNKNQSMRKSRTLPSFGSYNPSSSASTDHIDIDQFRGVDADSDSLSHPDSVSDIQQSSRLEYPGTALPNDIHAFLHVGGYGDKKRYRWDSPTQHEDHDTDDDVEDDHENITGGIRHLQLLSQQKVNMTFVIMIFSYFTFL